MRVTGYINGFSAGELSPDAWERADLQQHAKGMAPGENLLVLTTGPAVSRGGFWDRGAAKFDDRAGLLFGFARSSADALLLEFYHLGFRVFTPLGDPVMDGPDQVNVVTPFAEADLPLLWFKQIGDLILVTHRGGAVQPYAITRRSDTDWGVALYVFKDGPWLAENADPAFTIAASGIKGTVDLTATKDLFLPQHVGSSFRFRAQSSGAGMGAWTAAFDVLIDYEMLVSDGKIYRTTTAADGNKTGTNQPVHDHGSASDGGMNWEYLHDGSGSVTITAVTDLRHATGTVVGAFLPTQGLEETHSGADGFRRVLAPGDEATTAFPATMFWAECAFSAARGWPRAPAEEIEERLEFCATPYRPAQLFLTRTAAFTPAYAEFKPGLGTGRVVSDDAVRMSAGKAGAEIVWVVNGTFLIAATTDAEYVLCGANIDDPITPASNKSKELSRFGASPVAPVVVHGPPLCLLHVTRSNQVLRELRVAADAQMEGGEATILAAHIGERGFAQLAWQTPDEICWTRLADGGLAAFTFHQQQQVRAWTSQTLPAGFEAESICTVPAPATEGGGTCCSDTGSGGAPGDVLWALVRRIKDGSPQRRLWRLARRTEQMFNDGAQRYLGDPVSAVAGLGAYEGETVQILADGARQPDVVVLGGAARLKTPARDVIVGLRLPRRYESLPLDLQGVGSTVGKAMRTTHATVTLSCVDAMVEDAHGHYSAPVRQRPPAALHAPLVERIKQRVAFGGDADRDQRVVVITDGPFDLKVYSLGVEAEVLP